MTGRSVIVTGAAKGIGRAAALRFSGAGDRLVLVDRNEDALEEITQTIRETGSDVSYLHADISRSLDVHNIMAEVLDLYDRVDVLAHCDGMFFSAPLLETSEENFDQIINANLRSTFLLNQAVVKQIIRQAGETDDGGVDKAASCAIVNVTTTEAVTASPDHAVFASAQGAVTQLTKSVAMTLSPYGARANAIGVAAIREELEDTEETDEAKSSATPLERKGQPEEAANAIYFLASTEASFVTGQTLFVDGGRLAMHGRAKADPA